ncbi:MAG: DNA-binding protein WhiA [Halanaerobiales bacterium]
MSFTEDVKHELVRKETDNEKILLSELAALLRMNGSIQIVRHDIAVKITTDYGDLARKIYSLLKDNFGFSLEIIVRRHNSFSHNHIYEVMVMPQKGLKKFLRRLGLLGENNDIVFALNQDLLFGREAKRAYIRGVFLGAGSVNSPGSDYHLEFRTEYETQARDILSLLEELGVKGSRTKHKDRYMVYYKSYERVTKILNLIGATSALLKMESSHTLKKVKNNVNRRVNCETANLDKTVRAAMDQLENIKLVENRIGLQNIPESLREIAVLRKENPYASLKELGELLEPALSKSGVYHRLRRLGKMAQKVRGEK